MYKLSIRTCIGLLTIFSAVAGCKVPAIATATENRSVPTTYGNSQDTANTSTLPWRSFFTDKNLVKMEMGLYWVSKAAMDPLALCISLKIPLGDIRCDA
jgi:hypothetical protein